MFGKGSIITLQCGKLRNPRTIQATDVLNVQVLPPGSNIPLAQWNLTVLMKALPSFIDFSVVSSSSITGDLSTYTFNFTTGQELDQTVTLQIDLPPELGL